MQKRNSAATNAASPSATCGWRWAAAEVLFIFLMFFVFAGSPPPDVGEAHYLAKAKHYWDRSWCPGDVFLESKDAHGVFYWTFGWVTKHASLPAAAWIGRSVTWLLLAWSWRRLSFAVAPQRLMSILTAGLMLLLVRWCHMAGEWIVGGVEAKGCSYALVLLALESVLRERWRLAFLLAGGATAFHVLVGGWTGVAIGAAWLLVGRKQVPLLQLAPALVGAAALAAIAVVPALALSRGAAADIQSEANRIYVFERLSHHLVFHRLGGVHIARQVLLLAAWIWLAWQFGRQAAGIARLHAVVLGAVAIALAGVVIDQGIVAMAGLQGLSKEEYQSLAAPLLKFYWFRLSDALLAVGVALAIGQRLTQLLATGSRIGTIGLIVAMVAIGANLAEIGYHRSELRLPGSFLQPRPAASLNGPGSRHRSHSGGSDVGASSAASQAALELREPNTRQQFQLWRSACQWAADNTPSEAKFLTPRRQQSFKWYAGRAEVVCWKDVPQDAESIVNWKRTLTEVFPPGSGATDLTFHSDAQLLALARKYGASYILIDLTRSRRPIGLPRVYPDLSRENPACAIYRVPPAIVP